jgi:DNA (cytosine-5)-methyltransferase 1
MKAMPFGLNIGRSTIITVKCHYQDQRVSMSDLWEHIDLCSGIGGFSLGFQYAKLSEPILFCELDEFCQKILKKHWPDVPICNDVKELANDTNAFIPRPRERKRILTAGYPCQPFSQAGQRRGTEDPRHIWPYILRIIQQERFDVCVFENVAGHISLGLDEVLHDLEGEGYTTRTFVLPAEACGASHRRDRLWIIAKNLGNANDNGSSATEIRRSNEETARGSQEGQIKTEQSQGTSGRENHDDVADTNDQGIRTRQRGSVSEPLQQNDAGNNHAERVGDYDGNKDGEPQVLQKDAEDVADTNNERSQRWLHGRSDQKRHSIKRHSGCSSTIHGQPEERKQATQRRLGGMVDGLSAWMDEPVDIPRVASGQKNRTHRLKALGNAIVPQIAQRIGVAIRESF